MARGGSEIDRLIEQGLGLYGEGDLDGALSLWERVLVIDPDNAQATSYVDYVRMNYDLLTGENNTEDSGPFAIDDGEPEYQIEILQGEHVEPSQASPLYLDARDEGWAIADESGPHAEPLELELTAEEPPADGDPGTFEAVEPAEPVSFEDSTTEYRGGSRPTVDMKNGSQLIPDPEFVPEVTPAFGSSTEDFQTPAGFGSQPTDVRRRDLGFVQPAGQRGALDGAHRAATGPPELKMTLRTPQRTAPPRTEPVAEADPHRKKTADGMPDDDELPVVPAATPTGSALEAAYAALDLEIAGQPTIDLVGRAETRKLNQLGSASDLITTLPTPRASTTRPVPAAATADDERPTREMEAASAPSLSKAKTTELPYTLQLDPALAVHPDPQQALAATRDFNEKPTAKQKALSAPVPVLVESVISAPTRNLGLREQSRPGTEDETTHEVDVQKIRAARPPNGSSPGLPVRKSRPTKPELPGVDPIDLRSAEILEDIDKDAPASETREDRTRRRITVLLERAIAWGNEPDLERAVAAVDLALSEDPNSALAQKLIHRNRDTIMTAFQAFLGDVHRAPSLAKPLHELGSAPISPRAAFLLSRVDGTLTLEEILDVSGMPRLEAYRYLCQLFLRGILR